MKKSKKSNTNKMREGWLRIDNTLVKKSKKSNTNNMQKGWLRIDNEVESQKLLYLIL